jgi:hypothetical protein
METEARVAKAFAPDLALLPLLPVFPLFAVGDGVGKGATLGVIKSLTNWP